MNSSSYNCWWRQCLSSSSCGHMTPSHKWIMRFLPNSQLHCTHTHTLQLQENHQDCINQSPVRRRGIHKHSQELYYLIGQNSTKSLAGWNTGNGESKNPWQGKKGRKKKPSESRCVFDRMSTRHLLKRNDVSTHHSPWHSALLSESIQTTSSLFIFALRFLCCGQFNSFMPLAVMSLANLALLSNQYWDLTSTCDRPINLEISHRENIRFLICATNTCDPCVLSILFDYFPWTKTGI